MSNNPLQLRQNSLFHAFLAWLVDPVVPLRLFLVATLRHFGAAEEIAELTDEVEQTHAVHNYPVPPEARIEISDALFLDGNPSPEVPTSSVPPTTDRPPSVPPVESLFTPPPRTPLFLPDSDDFDENAPRDEVRDHPGEQTGEGERSEKEDEEVDQLQSDSGKLRLATHLQY